MDSTENVELLRNQKDIMSVVEKFYKKYRKSAAPTEDDITADFEKIKQYNTAFEDKLRKLKMNRNSKKESENINKMSNQYTILVERVRKRMSSRKERIKAEAARQTAAKKEPARKEAEAAEEKEAEAARKKAEAAEKEETARKEAEAARKKAEAAEKEETARKEAEAARKKAEAA
ncbi:hypothetical protein CYMTET_41388 [Cymbomonas tetramitiformis]|uniref:Uncharacterized protein n=1 Tax=Cymbomonas tetramitiformis TaxID=36881 RepID=A0AAE0C7U4_9CHLO|nr:hypothetical protein CYMTET_41388 [Cymbomonas tetramitiformis]